MRSTDRKGEQLEHEDNSDSIQLPDSLGDAFEIRQRKPNSVTWNANGHNTYTITLPYGYFDGYMTPPPGQSTFVITAADGGNSPTLTLNSSAPTGPMTPVPQISGPNCPSAAGGTPGDIMVDP